MAARLGALFLLGGAMAEQNSAENPRHVVAVTIHLRPDVIESFRQWMREQGNERTVEQTIEELVTRLAESFRDDTTSQE
jgi:hypothetical protein